MLTRIQLVVLQHIKLTKGELNSTYEKHLFRTPHTKRVS